MCLSPLSPILAYAEQKILLFRNSANGANVAHTALSGMVLRYQTRKTG
ncbi:MAG: hypothetical protein NT023_21130 [Armatimonadetes bacterium]|nr:hypothetical protein [Armatimonadota bacterium]